MSRHSCSTSARSSAVIGLSSTTIHICISVANHQAPKCAIWRRVQSRIVGCALDLDHTHIPSPRPNRPRSHAIDSRVCSKRSSKFARLTRWKHKEASRSMWSSTCGSLSGRSGRDCQHPSKFRLDLWTSLANFFDDDSLHARGEGAGSKEQCAIDRRQNLLDRKK